ncbi:MAG: hypothetical protein AAF483_10820 [Planctomycetota bacterium]
MSKEQRESKTLSSGRKRVFQIGLLLTSTALTLLASDCLLRLFLPIPAVGSGDWAGTPGTSLQFVSSPDSFTAVHRFNNLGFRGGPISLQPRAKFRVLCIGDSWTEGVGANENETWPAQLGLTLPQEYEVLNLGDAGSEPDRYLDILLQVGVPLKPTHCIICVIPSDFWGGFELPEKLEARDAPYDKFRERESTGANWCARYLPSMTYLVDRYQGKWHDRDGFYWEAYELPVDWFVNDLAHKQQVDVDTARSMFEAHLSYVEPKCLEGMQSRTFNGHRVAQELWNRQAAFRCTTSDMGLTPAELEATVFTWVQLYARTAKENSFLPTICFFPESGLVSRTPCGPMIDKYYEDAPDITQDNSLAEMLARVCREFPEITFIDCTESLRQIADQRLFMRYDGHPNARAYKQAAMTMATHFFDSSGQDSIANQDTSDHLR